MTKSYHCLPYWCFRTVAKLKMASSRKQSKLVIGILNKLECFWIPCILGSKPYQNAFSLFKHFIYLSNLMISHPVSFWSMHKASIHSTRLVSFKRRWYNTNRRFSLTEKLCPSMEMTLMTSGDPQVYDRASYSDSSSSFWLSFVAFRCGLQSCFGDVAFDSMMLLGRLKDYKSYLFLWKFSDPYWYSKLSITLKSHEYLWPRCRKTEWK